MATRDEALELWRRHNDDDSLYRHALAVEACMRHFATKHGQDPEYWGLVGLLHDVDYQEHPSEHLAHARTILSGAGYDGRFVRAVESHGYGLCTNVPPESVMEKTLYAVDELTGFIFACAYVRPSRSVMDLEIRSVRKKWGTVAFAAGVDRGVIERGAAMLGMPLDSLIAECIEALRSVADSIGLGEARAQQPPPAAGTP